MIEWIVASSVLIIAVLILRQIFREKVSKRLQYALWAMVLLRLLIPDSLIESAASVGNLLSDLREQPVVQVASGTVTQQAHYDLAFHEVLSSHDYSQDVFSALPQSQQETITQQFQPEIQEKMDDYTKAYHTAQIFNGIWLVGAVAMGLCLLGMNLHFGIRLRRSRVKQTHIGALPVYTSSLICTPCLFGLFRPAVYLPEGMEGNMEHVLAHEHTHYRHGDHIWAILRCGCLAIHWYNPLVWIAVKASRIDSELACDEGTLLALGDESRESYGRTLIEMSCAKPSMQDYLLTATTMTGDKKSLYRRIRAIAKKQTFLLTTVIILAVASLIIVGCTFTGAKEETIDPTTETKSPTESTLPTQITIPPETSLPTEPQASEAPTFPMGEMGQKTEGVLRSMTMAGTHICAGPFAGNLLLYEPQSGSYQLRSLVDGHVIAKASDARVANTATVTEDQIIYFAVIHRKIVFRDSNLEVTKVLDFDLNDTVSDMIFSQDGKKAYYSPDAHTIVELDLHTMEERWIDVPNSSVWSLTGVLFGDTILSYWGRNSQGDYTAFIDLKTGTYLGQDSMTLQTWGNNYYMIRSENGKTEHRVVIDESTRYLNPNDYDGKNCKATVLPQLNSLFALCYDYYNPKVLILDLYDLDTKLRTASLTVELSEEFHSYAEVIADPSGEYVWLYLSIGDVYGGYRRMLYRWDYKACAVQDPIVYGYDG